MQSESSSTREQKAILVVGDWFVDEHWATGYHRSGTASRAGRLHQRSLHKPQSAVQSLCGAGRTASVLYNARREKKGERVFDIYGIGMWHEQDTLLLEEMLDPGNHRGHTPFRILREKPKPSGPSKLFTLGSLPRLKHTEHGTEHIIRTYRPHGTRFEISERIDWILTPNRDKQHRDVWIEDRRDLDESGDVIQLLEHKKDIRAVVVKDHSRGVLSTELVRWLKLHFADKPWFVSTKSWMPPAPPDSPSTPSWLAELEDVDLRLFMIPHVPAKNAVLNCELGCWLTGDGCVTREAFQFLDGLHEEAFKRSRHGTIVVLPNGCSLLAREERPGQGASGWIQSLAEPQRIAAPVPMASVFLGAFVGEYLESEEKDGEISGGELLKKSLSFTLKWMEHESGRVEEPDAWKPEGEPVLLSESPSVAGRWDCLEGTWKIVAKQWRQAWVEEESARDKKPLPVGRGLIGSGQGSEQAGNDDESVGDERVSSPGCGPVGVADGSAHANENTLPIISSVPCGSTDMTNAADEEQHRSGASHNTSIPGVSDRTVDDDARNAGKCIELWRAMTDLNGYICVVESKRRAIRRIRAELERFCRNDPTSHVSCMVISEPGAGKTYLGRCLAEALDMRFRTFNITQMLSRQDLVKCFDKIASIAQTLPADERLLILIDEINAKLDHEFVYGAFLAPLEERVFIQHGQPHPIPPCAWIFAGTSDPSKECPESKGPDFYSRLTIKPVELRVEGNDEDTLDQARLENLYLGIALIRNAYPDVRFVSSKIVRLLWKLPINTATPSGVNSVQVHVRDIEQFVRMLDEVQYGQVLGRNVRRHVLTDIAAKFDLDLTDWDFWDEEIIKIVG